MLCSCSLLTAIGLLAVAVFFGKLLCLCVSGFVTFVLAPYLPLSVDWKKYGKWAVVTGASDGMGKEFAKQLARKGFNIVLISRSADKLKAVAAEIAEYKVETKCIPFDFSKGDLQEFRKLKTQLDGLEVGVLVNNVGIFFDYPDLLHQTPGGDKAIMNVLNVDVVTLTLMMEMCLPQMVRNRRGVIINLGSSLGLQPTGTYAVYSACKSYCIFLTEALRQEYADKGLVIQTVIPGIVSTNMAKNYRDAPFQTTADVFVTAVLSQVGLRKVTNGYWKHALATTLYDYTPTFFAHGKIFEDSAHRKNLFLSEQNRKSD
ncbi:very-long-chain 3-oxooacyl-coA reductase let-767-like [Paramacrobiotus metropolitanus]|uniref:very-long-chain 3-oxooacyl-coA reductase let-767-like n=1 Tax=Paramacrobiotus metropolitanus TaxID=2943436 RepID=UPI0024464A54|nr:very-long-chain 3-oxooacyl-coA reductase let-767-like [Paramacrobiotus metropolitanus]